MKGDAVRRRDPVTYPGARQRRTSSMRDDTVGRRNRPVDLGRPYPRAASMKNDQLRVAIDLDLIVEDVLGTSMKGGTR
jgi:hypothetical protein